MNVLDLYIDRWFTDRHVRAIRNYVQRHELSELFDWERSAIYRLPLPDAVAITIRGSGESEGVRFERSLFELLGLGHRCYILDSAPLALFGKPVALFVFEELDTTPAHVLRTDGHVLVNGSPFPLFDGSALRKLAVHNASAIPMQLHGTGPTVYATTITGPFPGNDLPPQPTPPANGPAATAPAGATMLFYGLCFQNPLAEDTPNFVGDPLWIQTNNLAAAFATRGFRTWTALAGANVQYEPTATSNADTVAAMMSAFAADLAAQTAFCRNPADQLVILIAAHGYGTNPTGSIAFHFNPSAGVEEWVTHVQLCDAIAAAASGVAGFSAAKTFLMVYSCNSGPLLDDALPGALQGMHVITATTGTGLSNVNFGPLFQQGLGRCDGTWQSFIQWLKHLAGNSGLPIPRNGDVKGCRWTIVLNTVTHSGGDIGDDWSYQIDVASDHHEVKEHIVSVGATDTQNLVVYDRFRGPCNPAPAPPTGTARATEHDIGTDSGSVTLSFPAMACDGGARTYSVSINVTESGTTATMTFAFTVTATCVP